LGNDCNAVCVQVQKMNRIEAKIKLETFYDLWLQSIIFTGLIYGYKALFLQVTVKQTQV